VVEKVRVSGMFNISMRCNTQSVLQGCHLGHHVSVVEYEAHYIYYW